MSPELIQRISFLWHPDFPGIQYVKAVFIIVALFFLAKFFLRILKKRKRDYRGGVRVYFMAVYGWLFVVTILLEVLAVLNMVKLVVNV